MADTARRVQFQLEKISLDETAPIQDTNDLATSYYVQADYERISYENQATIEMMNNGLPENEFFCPRGLEAKRRRSDSRRGRSMRRHAQEAVLDEQRRQQDENDGNQEMLAEIYIGYTKPCHTQAQRQATRDAAVAREIYAQKEQQQTTKQISKDVSSDDLTEATEESSDFFSLSSSDEDGAESVVSEEPLLMNQDRLCILHGKIYPKKSRLDRFFGLQNLLARGTSSKRGKN
jgi:hypothetical protein